MSNIQSRVDALEEQVERLRKYIVIRDGLWIKDHLAELGEFIISYKKIGDANLRMQLEFDNLMMCRARLQEDFLEYCRRATLQIEGMTDWALKKEERSDPGEISASWNIIQNEKKKRWNNPYEKEDFPGSVRRIKAMDSLELSLCVFGNKRYSSSLPMVKNQFNCLIDTIRMRNIASHRENDADPVKRMNRKEKEFFEERDSKYKSICESLNVLRGDIVRHFDL